MHRMPFTALVTSIAALLCVVPAANAAFTPVLLETITVASADPTPVTSTSSLDPSHVYQLDAVGEVSVWTSDPSGVYSGEAWGVDPLYCYVQWQCAAPKLWRSLRVNGVGLDEFGGKAGVVPYSGSHSYSVKRAGVGGKLEFVNLDAANGSASDNSGSWNVQLWDLGPRGDKVTFSLGGSANIVRNRPKFQWGTSHFSGRGTLFGTMNGFTRTEQSPQFHASHSMSTEILGYSYSAAAHGTRQVLVLSVRVTSSTFEKDCKVGTLGKVTLVDDDRRMKKNRQRRDAASYSFPVKACPSYVQGISNRDERHLGPPVGGVGGGQYANVEISYVDK